MQELSFSVVANIYRIPRYEEKFDTDNSNDFQIKINNKRALI